ncbi:AraC family transcriptional regulator [Maribellus sp. YY47]|uniref:AraC family transcriptional regulator n=1 Tax=Maribellus sp. YY47 TaxID=2929486 RepID=UPI0020010357|nr:AraC family transcriptional regulator [Maribellus sp. YY47]MCK3685583.1 AraC family transcriptional regulator [Maribellus sp. YY47]
MEINEEKLNFDKDAIFLTRHYKQDYFTSPRHFHNEYEIAYIEQSEGKLYVGNNIVDFKAGNLFIFAPKLIHSFKNSKKNSEKGTAKATIVLFKKEFLGDSFFDRKEAMLLNKLLANSEAGIKIFKPSREVLKLMKKLSFNSGLKSILDLLTILDLLSKSEDYELLTARWVKKFYYKISDSLIKDIVSFVEENYADEDIFKRAVELSGMGTASFSRYFKNRTEKTFSQYLNEVRINNAQKMLINTNLDINEICSSCGYNSLSYFSRQFKQKNGISPHDFRNTYLKIHSF